MPPRAASAGHMITVCCGEAQIVLEDVCFGDVFLLSGQSNMQLTADRVMDCHGMEVTEANYPLIRHFTVEPRYYFGKLADDIPQGEWKKAIYPDVKEFSAAGFFFAKKLHKEIGVPIGLVLNAMGGSTVEAWMPEALLSKYGDFSDVLNKYKPDGALEAEVTFGENRENRWRSALFEGDMGTPLDRIPDGAEPFTVPGMCFGTRLEGWSGSVFFYKEIELEREPEGDALLYVGNIYESNITYINGTRVGAIEYRYPPSKYPLEPGVLKKGRNIICTRILQKNGVGGFVHGHPYFLDSGAERIDLEGEWMMKPGTSIEPLEDTLFPPVLPTCLYNASFWPIREVNFTGMLWYQGESNAMQPERYDEKFADMIAELRRRTGQRLPVVCTELCDFDDPGVKEHDKSGWQEIQRQQREAPDKVPDCAVALGHDLGQPYDLHPQRKKELGDRMAKEMLRLAY